MNLGQLDQVTNLMHHRCEWNEKKRRKKRSKKEKDETVATLVNVKSNEN